MNSFPLSDWQMCGGFGKVKIQSEKALATVDPSLFNKGIAYAFLVNKSNNVKIHLNPFFDENISTYLLNLFDNNNLVLLEL
jgi:hypothetical protein